MKREMSQYLTTIGIRKHFYNKAKQVYAFYTKLVKDDVLDIFVSDYFDAEGTRQYESLWLFTKNYAM